MDRKPRIGDLYDSGCHGNNNVYWKIVSLDPFKAHWVLRDTLEFHQESMYDFDDFVKESDVRFIGNSEKSHQFKNIYDILNNG
jgi:hypothetical protein